MNSNSPPRSRAARRQANTITLGILKKKLNISRIFGQSITEQERQRLLQGAPADIWTEACLGELLALAKTKDRKIYSPQQTIKALVDSEHLIVAEARSSKNYIVIQLKEEDKANTVAKSIHNNEESTFILTRKHQLLTTNETIDQDFIHAFNDQHHDQLRQAINLAATGAMVNLNCLELDTQYLNTPEDLDQPQYKILLKQYHLSNQQPSVIASVRPCFPGENKLRSVEAMQTIQKSRSLISQASTALENAKSLIAESQAYKKIVSIYLNHHLMPAGPSEHIKHPLCSPDFLSETVLREDEIEKAREAIMMLKKSGQWSINPTFHVRDENGKESAFTVNVIGLKVGNAKSVRYLASINESQVDPLATKFLSSLRNFPSEVLQVKTALNAMNYPAIITDCSISQFNQFEFHIRKHNKSAQSLLFQKSGIKKGGKVEDSILQGAAFNLLDLLRKSRHAKHDLSAPKTMLTTNEHKITGKPYDLNAYYINQTCMMITAKPCLPSSPQESEGFTAISNDIFMIVKQGIIKWVSPNIEDILKHSTQNIINRSLNEFVLEDGMICQNKHLLDLQEGENIEWREKIIDAEENQVWADFRATYNGEELYGIEGGILLRILLIEEKVQLQSKLHKDSLTGLRNRLGFAARLTEYANGSNHSNKLGLIFIDVDNFKQINDRHGHGIGDRILQIAATRLEEAAGLKNVVCRYSGDEFVIAIPRCKSLQELAQNVAYIYDKTCNKADILYTESGTETSIKLQLSMGCTLQKRNESLRQAIERADLIMYKIKQRGGGGHLTER